MSLPRGETYSEHPPAPHKGPVGLGNNENRLQQMEENIRNLHRELGMEREARLRLEEGNERLHEKVLILQMSNHQLTSEHRRLAQRFGAQ